MPCLVRAMEMMARTRRTTRVIRPAAGSQVRPSTKGATSMAKHDTDPVLRQLVRAVNESENATVPLTVTVHGTQLTGVLLGEGLYFGELAGQNPLMAALEPAS